MRNDARGLWRRLVILASFAILLGGTAWADIGPGPKEPYRPEPRVPPAASPTPAKKACGAGMGLVVLAVGTALALRLAKAPPPEPRSAA
ncbi:MAG TPA: hypothetical protein VF950_30155 [Planctomycetota bacterium]